MNVRATLGKKWMKIILLMTISTGSIITATGQTISHAVYFETNESVISSQDTAALFDLISRFSHPEVYLRVVHLTGHTDSVGNVQANEQLSKRRCEAVRTLLVNSDVSDYIIEMDFHGEIRPAATNETAEGRATNRRVDVVFTYEIIEDEAVAVSPLLLEEEVEEELELAEEFITPDNTELYAAMWKTLRPTVQEIDPTVSNTFQTSDGSIFCLPAATLDTDCPEVSLTIYDFNSASAIVKGNATTMSNGRPIYSVGMYYVLATCNGDTLQLLPNRKMTVLVPVEIGVEETQMRGFSGSRLDDGNLDWTPRGGRLPVWSGQSLLGGFRCQRKCWLTNWLFPLPRREQALATELAQIQRRNPDLDFAAIQVLASAALNYYQYRSPNLGYINCDAFWNTPSSKRLKKQTVQMENFLVDHNTSIKLLFRERRVYLPSVKTSRKRVFFEEVPREAAVTVVAVQMDVEKEVFYLSTQDVWLDGKPILVKMERMENWDVLQDRLNALETYGANDRL